MNGVGIGFVGLFGGSSLGRCLSRTFVRERRRCRRRMCAVTSARARATDPSSLSSSSSMPAVSIQVPAAAPNLTERSVGPPSGLDPHKDRDGKVLLKSLTREELERFVVSLGEKSFRAGQLWRWMYSPDALCGSFDAMSDLSKSFRAKLEATARVDCLSIGTTHLAKDGTRKITFKLDDGGVVESVWIPSTDDKQGRKRVTLCVSSQLGCALNCQFCFTAKMGLRRHLLLAEIVDQVVMSKRFFDTESDKLTNVVFMGMGEPFHNIDNVIAATNTLLSPTGLALSHNKVTVSTSGLVPEIKRFLAESKANLAVSLNATTDEVRSWIMPINRKHNLEELLSTLRSHMPRREDGRALKKVLFEYVMLKEVNDSLEDAKRIVQLTQGIPCKVNLIHFNTHSGTEFEPTTPEKMNEFGRYLAKKGVTVTTRQSRGDDEMAACGQLGKPGDRPSPPRMKVPVKYADKVRRNDNKSKPKSRT